MYFYNNFILSLQNLF